MTPGELQLETPDYWKSYRTKNTVLLQQINWKRREKPWINRLTYQTIHCVDFFVSQFKQINCNEKTSMKQLGEIWFEITVFKRYLHPHVNCSVIQVCIYIQLLSKYVILKHFYKHCRCDNDSVIISRSSLFRYKCWTICGWNNLMFASN